MFLLTQVFEWVSSNLAVCVALLCVFLLLPFLGELRQHIRIYLAFQKVPTDPQEQHILFGHAPKMLEDMGVALDWFKDLSVKENWKVFKFCYGPSLYQLNVVHPEGAKVILRSDPKSDQLYYPLEPWLGKGLLIANGPRWSRNRRLLTPAFHYDILRPYLKVYAEAATTMSNLWAKVPEGESFDVFPYISLLTLDVMLLCTCSYYSNCQLNREKSPYIKAVYQLSELSVRRMLSVTSYFDWMYMLKPDYWQFRRACNLVHKFSMDIIQRRRAALKEKKCKGEETLAGSKRKYLDFIDILLEAKDEDGVGLTDKEIRAEVDTFVFEGHDTTAAALAWTLYNLALHPEHQVKCREEVDAIFEEKDEIGQEEVKSLVYLKYCIKESLRLFPPVAGNGRVLAKDTDICGFKMPRGTPVVSFNYGIHRNPEFWENPEEFNPLRFSPENSRNRHSHAYVPFSAGPRNCIGQEFAMNEERVVLANILRMFEVSLDETKTVKKDFLIILRPDALYLKLKHRDV